MQAPDFDTQRESRQQYRDPSRPLSFPNHLPEDAEWYPVDYRFTPKRQSKPTESWRKIIRETNPKWWLHISLFVLTAVACYLVDGIWYAVGLMSILLAHEMGHYVMSLSWGVRSSAPYFIPFPSIPGVVQSPIGTLGAVIVMKSRIPSRSALIDIGAAGPIAGFVVSLVAITIGLYQSSIEMLPQPWPIPGYFFYEFGESLLSLGLRTYLFGPLPEGAAVIASPLYRAGWVGLFVTALNLLPIGQLDGGHIAYALFRRNYRAITYVATAVLIGLVFVSAVWTLFAILALMFGRKHPPPTDDVTPIDAGRRIIGYLCIVILVLCFMPNPLSVVGL